MAFSDNDIAFLIAAGVFLISSFIYIIPIIVAAKKKSPKLKMIVLLDIFLGWTFVAWVVCLVLACKKSVPAQPTEKEKTPPEAETAETAEKTETEEASPEVETV